MKRFLVFARADRHQWTLWGEPTGDLSVAVGQATKAVDGQSTAADRAVVMEVSGTDALPMFTYRYGAKAS